MEAEIVKREIKMIPKLRFQQFDSVYQEKNIKDCIEFLTDYHANGSYEKLKENVDLLEEKDYALMIRTTNLEKNDFRNSLLYITKSAYNYLKKSKVHSDDIIINKIANAGATYIMPNLNRPVSLAMNLFLLRVNSKNSARYIYYRIKTEEFKLRALSSGTSTKTITKQDVKSFKIKIPSLAEQQKIAAFLSVVDKKIEQLISKKELLESYKKGVMQKLFSREIRFKDENGNDFPEWEQKKLKEIAERNTLKNKDNRVNFVLTNSAAQGIISQSDYFDRDIANQNNLSGYYVVSKDDFVYNPRISVHAPVGPIKRNKLKEGVMSPLYSIFRFNESINLEFIEYYFETTYWFRYLNSVANFGARHDRMNISNSDFFKMPIPYPCEKEQTKITGFLKRLDSKINTTSIQLSKTQKFKKGLLQQMFV